ERGGRAQEIVEGGPLGIVALRTLVARIEVVLEEIAVINLLKAVFPRLRARLGRRRVAAAFISQVRVRRGFEFRRLASPSLPASILHAGARRALAGLLLAPLGLHLELQFGQILERRRRVFLGLVQQRIFQQLLRDRFLQLELVHGQDVDHLHQARRQRLLDRDFRNDRDSGSWGHGVFVYTNRFT